MGSRRLLARPSKEESVGDNKAMASKKLLRMDNVGIMVEDLEAAIAFFTALGLELEGETTVEGQWVDDVVGLDGARSDIALMRTPDGDCKLELSKFHKPTLISTEPNVPLNTQGLHRIMFTVEDIDEMVARLENHGAKLIRKVVQYQNSYRLCYMRGPEGIIIGLAEKIHK